MHFLFNYKVTKTQLRLRGRDFSLKRVFPNLTRTRTYGWAGGWGSSDFGVQSMPSVKLLRGFDSNSPDFCGASSCVRTDD